MITMRVTAISPLLQNLLRADGKLCGVFSEAVGIRYSDIVVTFQSKNIAMPCGGVVDELPVKRMESLIGERVSFKEGNLLIGSAVQLILSDATKWEGMKIEELPPIEKTIQMGALREIKIQMARFRRETGFSVLLEALGWEDSKESQSLNIYQRALQAILLLRRGVWCDDYKQMVEAQKNLVGLGVGLTPSGDDFLTGFWTTLLMLSERRYTKAVKHTIGELSNLSKRTTLYGWSELWALQKGFCSEPLCTAIKTLRYRKSQSQALGRLAVLGGTTGLDTLLGIAEALQFI